MSMYGFWQDTLEDACARYATGEITYAQAYRKLCGIGLCRGEAQEHLRIAAEDPGDIR